MALVRVVIINKLGVARPQNVALNVNDPVLVPCAQPAFRPKGYGDTEGKLTLEEHIIAGVWVRGSSVEVLDLVDNIRQL